MNQATRIAGPRTLLLACLLLTLPTLAGCGGRNGRQAVSGRVTWQSQAVPEGTIVFFPLGHGETTNAGAALRNGSYRIPAERGLKPGSYQVRISMTQAKPGAKAGPDGYVEAVEILPERYNVKSELKAEVVAGRDAVYDVDLTPSTIRRADRGSLLPLDKASPPPIL